MLEIPGCKDYLESEHFTGIEFVEEKEGNMYFKAYCTDHEESVLIEFEPVNEVTVFVNVKYDSESRYYIYDRLEDE